MTETRTKSSRQYVVGQTLGHRGRVRHTRTQGESKTDTRTQGESKTDTRTVGE